MLEPHKLKTTRRIVVSLALIATFTSGNAYAQAAFYSGNDALELCGSTAPLITRQVCVGLVAGLNDERALNPPPIYRDCMPHGVELNQLVDIFGNYLRDHPETREQSAAFLFAQAISRAYPCL